MSGYFVYMLASRRNGTLYVGVTNNPVSRVEEHKSKTVPGFTKRYVEIASDRRKEFRLE